MAWTGPVIVVGAVAPQAAASPTSELVLDQKRSGVGERTFPMEKGKDLVVRLYKFVFALSGKASRGSKFTVTQITAGNAVIWQGQAYGSSAVIVRDTGNISGALKAYAIIAHGKGDTTEGWFTVGLPRGKASFDDSDFARYTEGLALASAAEEPAVSEEPEVVKEPEAEQSKAEQAPEAKSAQTSEPEPTQSPQPEPAQSSKPEATQSAKPEPTQAPKAEAVQSPEPKQAASQEPVAAAAAVDPPVEPAKAPSVAPSESATPELAIDASEAAN